MKKNTSNYGPYIDDYCKIRINTLRKLKRYVENNSGKSLKPFDYTRLEIFQFIQKHLEYSVMVFDGTKRDWRFDNLILIMAAGLPSIEWLSPLIAYLDKYKSIALYEFLVLLDRKFSGDWIAGENPRARVENMSAILSAIEASSSIDSLLSNDLFDFDRENFLLSIREGICDKEFTLYLFLKIDFIYKSKTEPLEGPTTVSIENLSKKDLAKLHKEYGIRPIHLIKTFGSTP